jgi:hypothetical protein
VPPARIELAAHGLGNLITGNTGKSRVEQGYNDYKELD